MKLFNWTSTNPAISLVIILLVPHLQLLVDNEDLEQLVLWSSLPLPDTDLPAIFTDIKHMQTNYASRFLFSVLLTILCVR